jgi:NAD(P)-dependent dehydrogenase (short-subunit alcohol dehydrogenase family)
LQARGEAFIIALRISGGRKTGMHLPNGLEQNILTFFRLDGRRALITGGAKGLGRMMALALAEAGAEVVIASRTLDECQTTAQVIQSQSGRSTFAAALDVTNETNIRQLKAKLEEEFGAIDILVNNAGINLRGNIEDLSAAAFDAVIDTNLKGSFLCAKVFGPGMAERGWGRIINLGSIMSVISMAGRTPYASSKAAVLGLTRTLALEWATKGVTVNAICPGPFATDMNLQLLNDPDKYKAFVEKIPLGRWGELHEIAGAAVFLASDAASYITGSTLFVDGGWTAQ